ncbi:MAG: DUF3887 domain-containing protein [Oscillospiraceae bacterium]|nr:DUF3887 domain-containing protein [Oscillospiraceae bacterium]
MKMKRLLGVVCAAALLLGALSGCSLTGTKPMPKGMDKEAVLAAGEEIVNLLLDGEYEAVVEHLREDIRFAEGKEIKPEHIKELVETHADPEEVGTFVKIDDTATMGETEPEPLGIALFKCEYTEKEVAFGIAYDLEMNLTGISIAHS